MQCAHPSISDDPWRQRFELRGTEVINVRSSGRFCAGLDYDEHIFGAGRWGRYGDA